MRRLRTGEMCPLHRSKVCCGRGPVDSAASRRQSRAYTMIASGVKQFPDGRQVCSPSMLKSRKDQLMRSNPHCICCGQQFSDYRDVELGHVESKGMNGWKRDDRLSNLVLMHVISNRECGSRSVREYMNDIRKAGRKFPCEVQ